MTPFAHIAGLPIEEGVRFALPALTLFGAGLVAQVRTRMRDRGRRP